MPFKSQLSPVIAVCALGSVVAIAGMLAQIAAGVDYPTVPPGIIMLAVTAVLVVTVSWPAIRILGIAVPGFVLVGGIVSGTGRYNISHVEPVGKFLGTVVQFIGLIAALSAGIVLVVDWISRRDSATL